MTNLELFNDVCTHVQEIYEAVENNNELFDKELDELDMRSDDYEDDVRYIERQRDSVITSLEAEIPEFTFKVIYYDGDENIFTSEDIYNDMEFGLPDINNFKSIEVI